MNTFFWILWWIVAAGAIVFYYFFFVGLADGSVSSFNSGIWTLIVIGFPALLGLTYWFKMQGWVKLAMLLLSVPAWPMVGYLIFLIAIMINGPKRWN
jgi:hypothetical protein